MPTYIFKTSQVDLLKDALDEFVNLAVSDPTINLEDVLELQEYVDDPYRYSRP